MFPASRFQATCPAGDQVSEMRLCPARMRIAEVLFLAPSRGTFQATKSTGFYPRVRVERGGRGVVTQAGAVLLVETVCKSGLDTAISRTLELWRKARAVHDPGKILPDVTLAVALGGAA